MNKMLNIFKPLPLPLPWSGYQCNWSKNWSTMPKSW